MPASRYDIYAEQGSSFKLHLQYNYNGGTGINLAGFSGAMQVRRSTNDTGILLHLTGVGVTGGGTTGEFLSGFGIAGSGGISFNTSLAGSVVAATGGILLKIDATTMKYAPTGKHFYDLELTNTLGEVQRLIEGTFEVSREVTR